MVEQVDQIEFVLNKYFQLVDGFWHQKRADQEISLYHSKQKSASKAGKASAKARRLKTSERTFNDRSQSVEPNIKHKTLNTNHKPLKEKSKRKVFAKPTREEIHTHAMVKNLNPDGFFDYYESNGWKVGKNPMKDWGAALRNWSRRQGNYINKEVFDDTSTDWVNQDHGLII
jgi:hypothetical protein